MSTGGTTPPAAEGWTTNVDTASKTIACALTPAVCPAERDFALPNPLFDTSAGIRNLGLEGHSITATQR